MTGDVGFDLAGMTLVDVMRAPAYVSPEDSLQRFVDVIAYTPYTMLPVVSEGGVVGYMYQSDVQYLLGIEDELERQAACYAPVSSRMRDPFPTIDSSAGIAEVRRLFASSPVEMVAIVEDASHAGKEPGRYLGVVVCRDLLAGSRLQSRPKLPSVGGMATPFGVYLSDGVNHGGAGNVALVAGGAALAVLATASLVIVQFVENEIGALCHLDVSGLSLQENPPAGHFGAGLVSVALKLSTTLVFLVLIRLSRIAGFHAAEHQTVHAIERGEPLVAEIVARMPRPHPRCGTNLLAAGILFWNLSTLFRAIPGSDADTGAVFAVIVTLFTWRRFGTLLQAVFTTRPARPRELASGISAANSLIAHYRTAPICRRTLLRRIWCSGLLQSMLGMLPTLTLLMYLLSDWLR